MKYLTVMGVSDLAAHDGDEFCYAYLGILTLNQDGTVREEPTDAIKVPADFGRDLKFRIERLQGVR